jgi:hypothetical protein
MGSEISFLKKLSLKSIKVFLRVENELIENVEKDVEKEKKKKKKNQMF